MNSSRRQSAATKIKDKRESRTFLEILSSSSTSLITLILRLIRREPFKGRREKGESPRIYGPSTYRLLRLYSCCFVQVNSADMHITSEIYLKINSVVSAMRFKWLSGHLTLCPRLMYPFFPLGGTSSYFFFGCRRASHLHLSLFSAVCPFLAAGRMIKVSGPRALLLLSTASLRRCSFAFLIPLAVRCRSPKMLMICAIDLPTRTAVRWKKLLLGGKIE